MKLVYWSFLISVVLKPFYIFKSGSLQPGDLFLLISFVLFMVMKKNNLEIKINKIDRLLFYFILFVIAINTFYAIYHFRLDFVVSTLHYIFNFIVIILFRTYSEDRYLLKMLFKVCKFNLWIQLFIFLLGWGEYYFGIRYMGTFNDPNQLSFFVYITLMIMFLISKIIDKKINPVYYLIVLFLIFQAVSTGMFLAIFSFIILLLTSKINFLTKFKLKVKTIIIVNFAFILLVIVAALNLDNINEFITDNFLFQRVEEKIIKLDNTVDSSSYDKLTLVQERGIDKLFLYPERIILGVGQGYYDRFDEAAHNGEVHSTLPSVLFYYGIIPFLLLIVWFIKNIRNISYVTMIVFIPLLLESFTLLNQRQPFFWMLFVLAYVYSMTKKERENFISSNLKTF